MTDATPSDTRRINAFKKKLRGMRKKIDGYTTPLIDPADIDIDSQRIVNPRERRTIDRQCVNRDLYWDVKQSTHVVAFYPNARVDLSKGVSDECTVGHYMGKTVFLITPRKRLSPFMDIVTKIFPNEDEFFKFFKPHMREAIEFYKRK